MRRNHINQGKCIPEKKIRTRALSWKGIGLTEDHRETSWTFKILRGGKSGIE